ncbi:MAG: ABC transporter substrate-binding protein [Solirubrobacterales bacterium]|nr:ABC transporter substrate-binding protein [Solirubrobacterales bacterium]MBV9717128.1 ABC transporter substrate-binding protein [Solirubrobacterales bacterium]
MTATTKEPRPWRRLAAAAAIAVAAIAVGACGSSSSKSSGSASGSTSGQSSSQPSSSTAASAAVPSYIAYTGGKAGAANPALPPVEIGFVNDQGGSTVIAGTNPTTGAQTAVDWVNKYAGGIEGHPLKLVTCFVKNAEAEGQTCAQQFLANPKVDVIAYGAMALGATTIDATVAGKKPIIEGVAINPPDLKTANDYTLFAAVPFIDYPWATFAKNYLHAKTAAILYPNQTGQLEVEQAVVQAMHAAGITTKLVGFDPNSTDVTGALEAAGAPTADFVQSNVATPAECLAFANSTMKLGIDPGKVLGLFQCQVPSIKSQYPGGDYPKWSYTVANNGVQYENNAAGNTYRQVFAAMGQSSIAGDPWSLVEFSTMLTLAKWMNTIGYAKLSPTTIAAQAKSFRGPLLFGPPEVVCGKYPSAPGVCADGDAFFKYEGNGNFKLIAPWVETPVALQKSLGARQITP